MGRRGGDPALGAVAVPALPALPVRLRACLPRWAARRAQDAPRAQARTAQDAVAREVAGVRAGRGIGPYRLFISRGAASRRPWGRLSSRCRPQPLARGAFRRPPSSLRRAARRRMRRPPRAGRERTSSAPASGQHEALRERAASASLSSLRAQLRFERRHEAVEARVPPRASRARRARRRPLSGVFASARCTSRHITLPEPSQIELSGASRYRRGMMLSST